MAQDGPAGSLTVWFQYVTPYSFQLSNELTEAPFRELATSETTEIDRLVLGAA
jgi:hypothetical protein